MPPKKHLNLVSLCLTQTPFWSPTSYIFLQALRYINEQLIRKRRNYNVDLPINWVHDIKNIITNKMAYDLKDQPKGNSIQPKIYSQVTKLLSVNSQSHY